MSDAAEPFDRPVDALSYEEARDELIAIVARLETGSATLDQSLGLWERGEALAAHCQSLLDGAYERIASAQGDDASDAGVVGVVAEDDEDER
ncbi:exodeoxyribonuclease VII small subunit [Demequina maris]|uniref:exodeoxyribonuclease VII small subunit n=1 Tax=Demequina maris TaxID=1638982 RepID=UPI0007839E4D|nr:exodeoxyribonuclease VII small subunit [Demequina maris]